MAEQTQVRNQAAAVHDDSDDSDDDGRVKPNFGGEKIGAKKRAKLEAKAEKKNQREAEMQFREDKKMREAVLEEEQRKLAEKEKVIFVLNIYLNHSY